MVDITLTELCQELRNWFDRARYTGSISFNADGDVYCNGVEIGLRDGQYYRVIGSVFADGVHQYPDTTAKPEVFDGAVWAMAVPPPVLNLSEDIAAWRTKYEVADSSAMSPYMSESFGGYSYQKGSALTSKNTSGGTSWQNTFASRLGAWRKL